MAILFSQLVFLFLLQRHLVLVSQHQQRTGDIAPSVEAHYLYKKSAFRFKAVLCTNPGFISVRITTWSQYTAESSHVIHTSCTVNVYKLHPSSSKVSIYEVVLLLLGIHWWYPMIHCKTKKTIWQTCLKNHKNHFFELLVIPVQYIVKQVKSVFKSGNNLYT